MQGETQDNLFVHSAALYHELHRNNRTNRSDLFGQVAQEVVTLDAPGEYYKSAHFYGKFGRTCGRSHRTEAPLIQAASAILPRRGIHTALVPNYL